MIQVKKKKFSFALGNKFRLGKEPWNKGKKGVQKVTQETRKKLSLIHKGNKNALGVRHTEEWKKHKSEEMKKRWEEGELNNEHSKGANHWNWKGGRTSLNRRLRATKEYALWRTAVFQRDDYTCIWCGYKGYLEADHIKPFNDYPELRFAIDNGRTLCLDCHKKTDTYFWKYRLYKKNVFNHNGNDKDLQSEEKN